MSIWVWDKQRPGTKKKLRRQLSGRVPINHFVLPDAEKVLAQVAKEQNSPLSAES